MDSLTQLALGAAVGQAAAGKELGRRAAVLGAICGTLPDLDVIVRYSDPVAQMTFHRTWSHSLFCLTLAAPVIWWLARRVPWWRNAGRASMWAVWLALITHPLLDAFTVYGTQMFLPFSDHPVSIGSVFIMDPLVTLPLAIALVWAMRRPGTVPARRALVAALAFCVVYLFAGLGAQQWVEARAVRAFAVDAAPPTQIKALATAFNSYRWRLLAMYQDSHCDQFVNVFQRPQAEGWRCYEQDRELEAELEDHWPLERMRWFSHGWYAINKVGDQVVLSDIRMGVEGFYIFRFVIGQMGRDGVEPVDTEQIAVRSPAWQDRYRAYRHPR